ncbi:MAG: orotate phosphoribosyltransferase [Chloroflexota bacterium]|nr:orotate phosphoribosyltransferase [Chloroflexota bacterium]
MVVSSLRCNVGHDRRRLIQEVVTEHALLRGDFTLSSGEQSDYYFDGKMATTLPQAAYLIAQEVFELIRGQGISAVGGLAIGADLIVAAVAIVSYLEGEPMPAFVIRHQAKGHGTGKLIEGQFPKVKGARVAVVDDVMTKGGSVLKGIRAVEEEGAQVAKVVVLLDRRQGGTERLLAEGYDVVAILHGSEHGDVRANECMEVARQATGGSAPR